MFELEYKPSFYKNLEFTVKDKSLRGQIVKKIQQLKSRPYLGKKLKKKGYWSLRVNKYRVIYKVEGFSILILMILAREKDYKELDNM